LLNILGIILIFKTFFKDLKYFKPIIIILRGILLLNHKSTIKDIVMRCHIGLLKHNGYYLIQFSPNRERHMLNTLGLSTYYCQLCLYLLWDFPSIIDISLLIDRRSKKDNIKGSKISNNSTKKRAWYEFVRLANNLGFKLKPIKEFLREDPNKVEI